MMQIVVQLRFIFLFFLFCFFPGFSFKSEATLKPTINEITATVVITGNVQSKDEPDSVFLYFKRDFVFNNLGREKIITACDSNGNFKFRFDVARPAKFSMFLIKNRRAVFQDFFIFPGDSIYLKIDTNENKNVTFLGKQQDKFNCMYDLDLLFRGIVKPAHCKTVPQFYSSDSLINGLMLSLNSLDNYGAPFFNILRGYKDRIPAVLYHLLEADILGHVNTFKCFYFSKTIKLATYIQKGKIDLIFNKSFLHDESGFMDSILGYSENFIEYLLRRSHIKMMLRTDSGKYTIIDMINLIKNDFKGFIRDRILTDYLLTPKEGVGNRDYEYCLKSAMKIIVSPIHKHYIKQQLIKFSQHSAAYNFSLPDIKGNYISLEDLKGKVVLIDFWFTGCTACISFHKVLEENVVPFYKDADVVFVTIGLDTEKEKWLKSVKTGFYTNDHSINLFTEGLGFAHPLATYYNIQGCPTLLLIDPKGNISSANPAWDPVKLRAEINAILKKSRPE